MVTLYKLLGVDENASKEVIKSAYETRISHPALDDICDSLIKKYGHKENMEELISVFFISKQNTN